jgi:hypothetical protein
MQSGRQLKSIRRSEKMHGQNPFRGLTKYLARLNFGPGAGKLS